jgi:hypothetical protein
MITINGTVGANGKCTVSGSAIETQANTALKIAFENKTSGSGTNLGLFAGTEAEFASGSGGTLLGSAGSGFQFLTIIDADKLSGKIIFVRREVGAADSPFTLTVE